MFFLRHMCRPKLPVSTPASGNWVSAELPGVSSRGAGFGRQFTGIAWLGLCFAVVAAVLFPVAAVADDTPKTPIRIILWAGGFAHEFDAISKTMAETLPKHAPMEIEVVRDGAFLDRPDVNAVDVLLMQHCFEAAKGVLTGPQKKKLLDLVHNGMGVVAVHASYYSFPEWDGVRSLYGTKFIKHGKVDIRFSIRFVDRDHFISKDLPATLMVHSELYESEPLTEDCHLLAVAEDSATDLEHPSVWTRIYGKGRVVTILPAHWPDMYENGDFQSLIAKSIVWSAERDRD